jgi:hypothetical protein
MSEEKYKISKKDDKKFNQRIECNIKILKSFIRWNFCKIDLRI